jgi:UDP-N-acetylglucosamine/UDP-N-acetyl-alpha-D-glucosaminouronate 4-epimerase
MRVLVTGGAGFIGSHLVEHLVAGGHDVVIFDDLSTGRVGNLAAVWDRIRFIRGTVTRPDECRRAVRGADVVLHQAALTSVVGSVAQPLATHHVNATSTLNLLLAARDAGVKRVVIAGSTAAYGDSTELPNREHQAPRPCSAYAASKLTCEAYAAAFYASYGLETVTLRYFNVFGPRQDPASQYAAVVPKFISTALANESPVIYGDGEQTRDFTFVGNVVHANMLAMEAPAAQVAGQVFNVGTGRGISVRGLWDKIRRLVGCDAEATYAEGRPGEVRHSLASLAKARRMLGFTPQFELDEGLRMTVAHYRETVQAHAEPRALRSHRAGIAIPIPEGV